MCQINYIVIQQYEQEKTESFNDNDLNLFNHFKRSNQCTAVTAEQRTKGVVVLLIIATYYFHTKLT